VTNSQWARRLPVKGCDCCIDGYVTRHDYNVTIKCPKCKGTGTLPIKRWRSSDVITKQITKNKEDDS